MTDQCTWCSSKLPYEWETAHRQSNSSSYLYHGFCQEDCYKQFFRYAMALSQKTADERHINMNVKGIMCHNCNNLFTRGQMTAGIIQPVTSRRLADHLDNTVPKWFRIKYTHALLNGKAPEPYVAHLCRMCMK